MNITFLMGNGFDIGLGLQTGYGSFYEKYCKLNGKENDNIREFKIMLANRQKDKVKRVIDWSDFEKAFGQHSSDFTIDRKWDYIERFEDFVISFNEYLEDEEKWADFSDTDRIVKKMNAGVTTYFHIRPEDRETIQQIYNSTSGNRIYNFASFNYTKSVDRCAEILKQHLRNNANRDVGKIVHVHGYIEENMIMGVNDPSQITNPEFANDPDVIKELVKPRQNVDIRYNYDKQLTELINASDIICVYGMSIGETDKKWWKCIAEWLSKKEKRALVILRHDSSYNKRFPFNVRYYDKVVDKFLSLTDIADNEKEAIRPRIFVEMNYDVFEMRLRKKTDDRYDTIVELAENVARNVDANQIEAAQKALNSLPESLLVGTK